MEVVAPVGAIKGEISAQWAINAAINVLNGQGKTYTMEAVKRGAIEMLTMRDEIKDNG